jgi:hypothetical protein
LTVSGMIDLYKKAAYDFSRWVEVIPKNLRRFRMWVWVSEVRDFSRSSASKAFSALQEAGGNNVVSNDNSVKSAKPFFQIELKYCTWDIDSTSNVFADLSRSPSEVAAPTIKIFYEDVAYNAEYGNNSLPNADRTLGEMLGDIAKEKLDSIASGAIDRTVESLQARALLGNVHGLNLASTIQDAFNAGSVNGIANILNGVNTTSSGNTGGGNLGEVHDTVPQKNESPRGNVYGNVAQDSEGLTPENVYTNSNVTDNEGPINQNVHK